MDANTVHRSFLRLQLSHKRLWFETCFLFLTGLSQHGLHVKYVGYSNIMIWSRFRLNESIKEPCYNLGMKKWPVLCQSKKWKCFLLQN